MKLLLCLTLFTTTVFAQSSPLKTLKSWIGKKDVVVLSGRDAKGLPCEVTFRTSTISGKQVINLTVYNQGDLGSDTPVAAFEGGESTQKMKLKTKNGLTTFSSETNMYNSFKMIYEMNVVADSKAVLESASIKSTHYFLGAIPRTKVRTCENLVRQ